MTDQQHENPPQRASPASFREFLHAYRLPILIILLLAFSVRVVLAIGFPREAGDEKRYTVPAVNLLAGNGYSSDVTPPIRPGAHPVPLYPLFIAAVYAVFGQNNSAVRIAQSAVDLITCLLVAFASFRLAPAKFRKPAALLGLVIYGLLCWFTISWTRYILAETLATFVTMLAITVGIMTLRTERWRWLAVGFICGVALMVRADALLLVAAFGLFLLIQIIQLRTAKSVVNLLLFCAAVPIVLAPWTLRNQISLGRFQPLASPYGLSDDEYVPEGYLLWIRTWMTDQKHYLVFHPVLFPGSRHFDARQLPDEAFDNNEEKERVVLLIDRYNTTGQFTPAMSDEFQALAKARIKRAPIRFFVWLPLQRIAGMWLTGFATTNKFNRLLRIALVLPILIGGIIGFAFLAQNRQLVQLLLLVILVRTLFFGFLNSSEHYIVEAYPPVIAACGVTCAFLWWRLQRGPSAACNG